MGMNAMVVRPAYPTPEHAAAAQSVVRFLRDRPGLSALLLTCSCARGRATADSCLDLIALLSSSVTAEVHAELEHSWREFHESDPAVLAVERVGKYSEVELDFRDGHFAPQPRGPTSGPDGFELEIGNTIAYSFPLLEQDDRYPRLRQQWLPYYPDDLRRKRLAEVRRYCLNNLDHIPLYVARGLYFQSFHRLYDAFREFLQGLFISRRTYPIAYDKWIREQVVEILGLPELYAQLPRLLEIRRFESDEIARKAAVLRQLVDEHVVE